MGAYLSKPVTDKASGDGNGGGLDYGFSEMQGWRISMEDAHSCLPEFGKDTSFFGVFDGHGGPEVAQYCAKHLPDMLKDSESFKDGNFKESLIEAFLKLDKSITTEEVISELKELAGEAEGGDVDEAALLNEEANMPIEQLLERMKQGIHSQFDSNEDDDEDSEEEEFVPEEKQANGIVEKDNIKGKREKNKSKTEDKDCAVESKDMQENGECKEDKKVQVEKDEEEEEEEENDDDDEENDDVEEEEEEEESEEDDEEEDDEDDDLDEDEGVMMSESDEVGKDSGTTAIVSLLNKDKLYVANAGDSRCVLCRNGKAIDMSLDHKPEDQTEKDRIQNAGGKITADGRVNGGLNLSRAIGDHSYKKNEDLKPGEQIIIAVPDVKEISITKKDDFLILACDGIWNVMTSQEAVDFVYKRLQDKNDVILSKICEEMFEHCLAADTSGDGSGCDNMTCIIVRLNTDGLHENSIERKRPLESNEAEPEGKKQKVD